MRKYPVGQYYLFARFEKLDNCLAGSTDKPAAQRAMLGIRTYLNVQRYLLSLHLETPDERLALSDIQ